MTHQNCARAILSANLLTYLPENPLQRIALVYRGTQRVVRIDTVDGKRRGLHIRAFEGLDVITSRFTAKQCAIFLWIDENCRDLEECIGFAIETTRLDVYNDRKKAPEPL